MPGSEILSCAQPLGTAIEMDPSFVRAHWLLGLVSAQLAKYDVAIAELEKALELSEGATYIRASASATPSHARGGGARALEIVDHVDNRATDQSGSSGHFQRGLSGRTWQLT